MHSSPLSLGALWARDEVERLEDRRVAEPQLESEIDAQIADLGVTHQIQTRLTSFVAVDEASQVMGDALNLMQPTAAPDDGMMVRAHMARCCSVDTMDDTMDNMMGRELRAPRTNDTRHFYAPPPDRDRLDRAGSWIGGDGLMPIRRRTSRKLPVIHLLGGTRGLPRGFGSRDAWARCGLELLADAQDAAALRRIFLKREFMRDFVTPAHNGPEASTLPYSLVMLVMRAAWDPRNCADGPASSAARSEQNRPKPERWAQALDVVTAHIARPGIAEFMAAADAADIPAMIRAAVKAARTQASDAGLRSPKT